VSTAHASVPVITNAGNTPATNHKLFVNVPVADVQRSIRFFEALGFRFSPQFTTAEGTCMLVGRDAYFMLLTKERFAGFSHMPVPDPRAGVGALFTVSVESREAVDAMVRAALAAGGSPHVPEPEDHGFMYDWSFLDPDGHGWGVFWMDPSAVPSDAA
jgi:predicted lactoylglutathione lyase